MKTVKLLPVSTLLAALLFAGAAGAQTTTNTSGGGTTATPDTTLTGLTTPTDPGVQSADRGTGKPLQQVANDDSNTNAGLSAFFSDGLSRFQDVESVSTTGNPNVNNTGLGPRFNFNQCAGCHVQPSVGGTGGPVNFEFTGIGTCTTSVSSLSQAPQLPIETFTPLESLTTFDPIPTTAQVGAVACSSTNSVPFFITKNGPTREARFPFFFNSNGTVNMNMPNGGVEDLFTVSGRPDGPTQAGCDISQPPFSAANSANNIVFRIPTPVFGLGLLENVDDSTLLINREDNLSTSSSSGFGISGKFNHNPNDNTISRLGWKAQNKSAQLFAGEAYNVEMGISNLIMNNERPTPDEDNELIGGLGLPSACLNLTGNGYPEDANNPHNTGVPPSNSTQAAALDDASAFANFMRFLAPPPPGGVVVNGVAVAASTISAGQQLFNTVGCGSCHNPSLGMTQMSSYTPSSTGVGSLSKAPVNAFSDLELHHMGSGLNDNVQQGFAGGDQFRTAPLWGVGQRIFLLHDGRTTNLLTAIADHSSTGSEASTVVANFNALTVVQRQEILDFLRSL